MSVEVERVILPQKLYPEHYFLELTPDLKTLTFEGELRINVDVREPTDTVKLNSKELFIKEASFQNSDLKIVEISYNRVDTTVSLRFDKEFPLGKGSLVISYSGILNGDMAGFYKSNYKDANGNPQVMASTQFEAIDARRAFPCWDEPAVKALFSVTMVVDENLTAISNMPETSVTHEKGGRKRVVFDVTPLMSTYLLAWAVGSFDFVQGVTSRGVQVRVYSPPGRAEHGNFALGVAKRALDFYDDFFQEPYPLPKLDMLCCTEFAMGAMENWGLVTYREVDLMIDAERASSQQKQRVAIVVAHELAHQWFGNLVTMDWWEDIWLNEGFACYMEHFCTDKLLPDYRMWEQYTTDAMAAAQRLDSLRSSHPIQVPMARAEDVEQVFDAISYCKGSTVVRMVACVLGPEKFREGLQLYMHRHQYRNTRTLDLWRAWQEVSGVDVPGMMASWTQQMGHPYLRVLSEKWSSDSVTFELEQNWFLADGSGGKDEEEQSKLWSVPLIFATSTSVSEPAVLMKGKKQSFTVPLSHEKDWVKLNAGQGALARVSHSPEMISRLKSAIANKTLEPIDRAALLLDTYALAKAGIGDASVEQVVELLRAYENEDNSTVWSAISGVLRALHGFLIEIGGNPLKAFSALGARMVKTALKRVGWKALESDSHTDKLLRATVVGLLTVFCDDDDEILAEAKRLYDLHWEEDPTALSSDFRTTVFKLVLQRGGVTEYDKILAAYYKTEDNAERKHIMNSLGAAPTKELKLRTLDWAVKSGDVKLQDFFYPIGSVSHSGPAGAQIAYDYFKENLETIIEMLRKASPSLMDAVIVYSCGAFCTLDKADEVEGFFEKHPFPSNARRIQNMLETMRVSGGMLEKVKASSLLKDDFWTV